LAQVAADEKLAALQKPRRRYAQKVGRTALGTAVNPKPLFLMESFERV
jgi:hypothetical protein